MVKKLFVFIFLLAGVLFSTFGHAAPLVESTFNTDNEGWRVGNFFIATGVPAVPGYLPLGNPPPCIRTEDIFDWNAFLAPAKFLGNQSAAFGGSLSFDIFMRENDNVAYYAVILEGGGLQLGFSDGVPPLLTWSTFTIPLTGNGWLKNLNTGSGIGGDPATAAELQAVLGNLTALRINADWKTGADLIALDNVRLNPAPLPATGLLLASGLLILAAGRRQTKK